MNITFDEYGNILENNYGTEGNHGEVIILSKDIRDFYLSHNELVNKTGSNDWDDNKVFEIKERLMKKGLNWNLLLLKDGLN